ncbi:histidine kinase [Salipiger aestuarii]|uniref:histidine kinase n=1 Tax=Salipiger aestuarii TaxID=568098 RepID=A0A327Y2R4_9RHOB|nr:HWE histidine kinase domain-containing protein [Salipiger aestuarii]EIE49314.1 response regulator receiver modulated GAF sensor protein [Citreicella sp. 357]KAA8607248.1 histidine kinase [Salipiger aestuarii]KAA8607294.1 histidine kinase [Salipiger aestuarii]KAB2541714.1 histidine kinase [Salipiger aestuarii]RAK15303.1 light-regulated signal transduction histidine kinase (bacteriophytochrome) [Salipiger aestuarii]
MAPAEGRPAPTPQVDLTNCDREPIHRLGRVQSYGALVAVSADLIVQHASENLGDILGVSQEAALGRPLTDLIVSDGFQRIRQALRGLRDPDGVARLFGVAMQANGRAFDVSVHGSGNRLIIEFEPKAETRGRDVLLDVYPHIAALRHAGSLADLARDAARALREMSGFGSVMVYQFQPDASGKVIAESRADGQRKHLGQMFPASDIPTQARALYMRALLRLIADVDDTGSPISPPGAIDGAPIDLSLAATRSVSPIHLEYLRNMGVRASMSVSIMKDGALWGLFACHHETPRYIDYERRTAIEMFAHMFSYELTRHETAQRKVTHEATSRLQTQLMAQMADGLPLAQSLLSMSEDLATVIPHDGLVLYENGTFSATGSAPTEEEFGRISQFLDRSIGADVFQTHCLGRLHAPAREYEARVAGILAVPVSKRPRDYLVLTRRQVEASVTWAGNPDKPVELGPNGIRLTPRKSFEAWRETVVGQCKPWSAPEIHAAELLRTALLEVFLKVTDAANMERKRAQEQQQLLISELNHRVRNILNLMRGLLAQSKSHATTLEEFTANLDGRIQALARAHDQLTSEQWEPASFKDLLRCEFAAYAAGKAERVRIIGPDAMVSPKAYTTLALVLHEMATNSVKYGALRDENGKVVVQTSVDRSGGFLFDWVERGGPPVSAPKRRGFGSTIIEEAIPHELRGDADISYKLTGVEARFRLPPAAITGTFDDIPPELAPAPATPPDRGDFRLQGTGLVLEDTLIIAMDAASILEDLGASKVEMQSSVSAALDWVGTNHPDFAVLDVNLGDEQSLPVAEALAVRGVPFVLATGYGEAEELARIYPPCVIVQKPFSAASLEQALRQATADLGRGRN